MTGKSVILSTPLARRTAAEYLRDCLDGWIVEFRPPTRSSSANAKLHAELQEIAARVPWAGALRDVETWKRLMTAAWLRARGEAIELLPALDGRGVDIVFRRTSLLTGAEMGELIEFVSSWKSEHMEGAEA